MNLRFVKLNHHYEYISASNISSREVSLPWTACSHLHISALTASLPVPVSPVIDTCVMISFDSMSDTRTSYCRSVSASCLSLGASKAWFKGKLASPGIAN